MKCSDSYMLYYGKETILGMSGTFRGESIRLGNSRDRREGILNKGIFDWIVVSLE